MCWLLGYHSDMSSTDQSWFSANESPRKDLKISIMPLVSNILTNAQHYDVLVMADGAMKKKVRKLSICYCSVSRYERWKRLNGKHTSLVMIQAKTIIHSSLCSLMKSPLPSGFIWKISSVKRKSRTVAPLTRSWPMFFLLHCHISECCTSAS